MRAWRILRSGCFYSDSFFDLSSGSICQRYCAAGGLPAPPLSEDVDHVAQPFCALQPLLLQAQFHAVRVALLYSFNDVLVLCDREVKVLDNRARIQAPVSFGLPLNRSVKRQEAPADAAMDNQPVEVPI